MLAGVCDTLTFIGLLQSAQHIEPGIKVSVVTDDVGADRDGIILPQNVLILYDKYI